MDREVPVALEKMLVFIKKFAWVMAGKFEQIVGISCVEKSRPAPTDSGCLCDAPCGLVAYNGAA